MEIEKLYLEVTRMCNLECEHCLRGSSEKLFMSPETILNILKDVKKVNKLLITGGEPLLAIRQLRLIIELIRKGNIEVNTIMLITNSTIMSENVLDVLRGLSSVSKLNLKLSYDMFHNIELKRLNLQEKRRTIAKVLKEEFGAEDYGSIETDDHKYDKLIESKGRALKLTPERLVEINGMSGSHYVLSEDIGISYGPLYYYDIDIDEENGIIEGTINIDVTGNVVTSSQSFETEDEEHNKYNSNVNELGLLAAIKGYSGYFGEKKRAWEEKIGIGSKRS